MDEDLLSDAEVNDDPEERQLRGKQALYGSQRLWDTELSPEARDSDGDAVPSVTGTVPSSFELTEPRFSVGNNKPLPRTLSKQAKSHTQRTRSKRRKATGTPSVSRGNSEREDNNRFINGPGRSSRPPSLLERLQSDPEVQSYIAKLKSEVDLAKARYDASTSSDSQRLRSEIERLTAENASLKQTAQASQAPDAMPQAEVSEEMQRLRDENVQLRKVASALPAPSPGAQSEIETLRKQVDDLNAQINSLSEAQRIAIERNRVL